MPIARSAPFALILILALGLLGTACGGDTGGVPGGPDAALPDASGGVDADPCTGGSLCGQPATCCAAGNECFEGACLPACASGVRCGDGGTTCCPDGDVCLGGACTTPGAACGDSYDCVQPGEFCEPTLGQCLPQPDPLTCKYAPTFSDIAVTVEWSFETDQIISIPVVADMNDDDIPEVVVNLTRQNGGIDEKPGAIAILNGRTGAEVRRIPHDPTNNLWGSHGRSTIALGDVSGDGRPDVVYAARPDANDRSLIVAANYDGHTLWTSRGATGLAYPIKVINGAVTLANFDGDPQAEIVLGGTLLDHDGRVVWDALGNGDGGALGTNQGYVGGISAVADLDGDGSPEIVTGRQAWKVSWTQAGAIPVVTVTAYWAYGGADGYPAIADLDGNGKPEVVLVASSNIIVLDGQSGQLWCGVDPTGAACQADGSLRTAPLPIPGGTTQNRGGPPTIADFDKDGRPEIGVAGGYAYSVYDLNRPGEDIPPGVTAPAQGQLFVRWSKVTQDLSSNATGSSVFDFQGDGAAEVVYADECYLRVYDGRDGSTFLEIPSTSATIHEYPLVVDVDGDNNSEILIVANDVPAGACPTPNRRGLFVYGDPNDEWVPTRRVWPQHTYHVTNATSEGNVPLVETDSWTAPGVNSYRQNVQGEGVFNAPDLAVDLSIGVDDCQTGKIVLQARVKNEGALGVPAGVVITFFQGTDASGTVLGTGTTGVALLPGASTLVTLEIDAPPTETSYFVAVDGTTGAGAVVECDESNNGDLTTKAGCPIVE